MIARRGVTYPFGDLETPPKHIIHDPDAKFIRDFRKMIKSEGIKPVRIGPREGTACHLYGRCVAG